MRKDCWSCDSHSHQYKIKTITKIKPLTTTSRLTTLLNNNILLYIEMKVITDGTEQLINLLANDTPLQLPTFRHEVMPSSQSHQVGQTPTRSHQGNEGGPAAQQHQ